MQCLHADDPSNYGWYVSGLLDEVTSMNAKERAEKILEEVGLHDEMHGPEWDKCDCVKYIAAQIEEAEREGFKAARDKAAMEMQSWAHRLDLADRIRKMEDCSPAA